MSRKFANLRGGKTQSAPSGRVDSPLSCWRFWVGSQHWAESLLRRCGRPGRRGGERMLRTRDHADASTHVGFTKALLAGVSALADLDMVDAGSRLHPIK